MVVTGIERQTKRPGRYSIFVDGEFAVGVRSEVLLAAGVRIGDGITPERIEQLKIDEELGAARGIATRYLGIRRRTEWEVRRRLTSKAFPESVIEDVVGELLSSGQINDREFILAFVHDAQLRKPSGPRMLAAKLRGKGLNRQTITEVLPMALPDEEQGQLALKCASGYVSKLKRRALAGKVFPPGKMQGMLRGYLAGRGFESAEINAAMKSVLWDTGKPE